MLEPMLASLEEAPLTDPHFVYEPKYDGIRAIAEVSGGRVRLWSRLGNEKTQQFPEIAEALQHWARGRKDDLILDGEIVALDAAGHPIGFQNLQGRIHIKGIVQSRRPHRPRAVATAEAPPASGATPTAFIVFDLLRDGATDWRSHPLTARRAALERVFKRTGSPLLRLSEQVRGDGQALYARATAGGWEGLIAKRADSKYRSGKRSPDWRKMKILREQEFVVGGWTDPRHSRSHFGSLILGVYEHPAASAPAAKQPRSAKSARSARGASPARPARPAERALPALPALPASPALQYVGHVGTGFNERELTKLMALFKPLATDESPFEESPPTNERPHWVKPKLVVMVRFTEWTADGILRHPVYLGLRDDKKPTDVTREDPLPTRTEAEQSWAPEKPRSRASARAQSRTAAKELSSAATPMLLEQLTALEKSRKDGMLDLGNGQTIAVTNLQKVFWPRQKLTKGDLFRYYVQAAPFLLPVLADRPLVMKRFPNGVAAPPFYQHRVEQAPEGIRIEPVASADARPQIIGGDLLTLVYTTQLAAISQDPWFSRVQTPSFVDFVAFDLDPAPKVAFERVLAVALAVRDVLKQFGATGFAKTSGSDGLHVFTPLPPETPYEAGLLFAEIVATLVAQRLPKDATVERTVSKRGPRIYVDFLQNIQGKTLASAYSARASDYAGVSTPLSWAEIEKGISREDFTIVSVPTRLKAVGDLWAPLRSAKPVDLGRVAGLARSATR